MAEIQISKHSGFCFGVKRAVETVERLIESSNGKRICIIGTLIHNPTICAHLEESGVITLNESDVIDFFTEHSNEEFYVVLRTHGQSKNIVDFLSARENITLIDCTCIHVKKIHEIVTEHTDEDTLTIIYGDKNHPEVAAISSYVKGDKLIFSSSDEVLDAIDKKILTNNGKNGIICVSQTTQNIKDWKKTQKIIKKLYTNAKIFDTICNVTEKRQQQAKELAQKADVVLVIGGRNSSNTKKLYDICKEICSEVYFAETSSDLPRNFITAPNIVGIAAGASTPDGIIEEVKKTMSEIIKNEESFETLLNENFKTLNTGDAVSGTVISVSPAEVKIDLGMKVTGILTLDNVTDDPQAKLVDLFKVGDVVDAVAYRVSDIDGIAYLSKKKVDGQNNWKNLVAACESGEILEGKIIEAIKSAGLIITINSARAFIPASHSGLAKDADLSQLVGTTQRVKIIEINQEKRRATASIRVVAREERKKAINAFWETVEEGKAYTGVVKSLTSYGAFVDLGGVDGMVHITELSWQRIKNPADVVSVGDTLNVFIKSFDKEKGRISLGYKTEEMNPWNIFNAKYALGDVAEVKVVSLTTFGAFAQIVPGVDGLIHISQIAVEKIKHPSDVLKVGDVVNAKIVEIDDEKQKVNLSIRALLEEEIEKEISRHTEEGEEAVAAE